MSNYDKFTQALIDASLESGYDDQVGCTGEPPFDWAALFTFMDKERKEGFSPPTEYGAHVVPIDIGNYAGAILFCNNDGIYSCERYSDAKVLAKRWEQEVKDLTVEDNE